MLKFDFSYMFSPNIDRGITENEFSSLERLVIEKIEKVNTLRPGFVKIIFDNQYLDTVQSMKEWINGFENFVVIGIGGSSLGARAIKEALCCPDWNYLEQNKRNGSPKLFFLENPDPDITASVLDRLDLRHTLFDIVSKSGSTAECMAHYQIVRGLLQSRGLSVKDHLIFTTDPHKGVLRKIANSEEIRSLDVPVDVGGRFSVLSSVGLLPALACEIDIAELIHGARDAYVRSVDKNLLQNPSAVMAMCHYLHKQKGRTITVMMPYSNRLYGLADWFRQLWAESLGKKTSLTGEVVNEGLTPIKALGAVDQHSQVQLYNEGPDDKTITFLQVERFSRDVWIPPVHEEEELSYLSQKTLSELLNSELLGTERALASHGRPSMRIIFPRIEPYFIGQFFMYYEFTTAIMAELLKINAYDQPGVELGKKITYHLMRRKGFENLELHQPLKRVVID